MRRLQIVVLIPFLFACAAGLAEDARETVTIIGTGDMGNSPGPKLASSGYSVIYGSRDPSKAPVQALVEKTGSNSMATTQLE